MKKTLFKRRKAKITAKGAVRLARQQKPENNLVRAARVYEERRKAEADALRRGAEEASNNYGDLFENNAVFYFGL